MFQIKKAYAFSASHHLTGLPDDHQCARLHGHNYIVEIVLESAGLNEVGFVKDYGDLKPIKEWLDDNFDHRNLNDILDFNPTSELFAKYILDSWRLTYEQLIAVRVSETPTSWAEYRL
jgi:6-pyruvoyltetrahydropterin/6-carboxytetrahydropterin synthase